MLKHISFARFFLIYIPIILVCYFGIFHYYDTLLENKAEITLNSELNELKVKKIIIDDFFTALVEDIDLLSWEYTNANFSQVKNSTLKQMDFFRRFSTVRKSYDQVRYMDTLGNEVIRVDYKDHNQGQFIEQKYLQNKSHRYYFKSAQGLAPNEIYFSKIDLNIENGQIETPYNPVVRAAKKVYDQHGNYTGIIVTNHYINDLSSKLITYDDNIHSSFELVDNQGYWLMANNPEITFSHIKPGKDSINLKKSCNNLWNKIQNNQKGFYRSKEYSYAFFKFSPTLNLNLDKRFILDANKEFTLISKLENNYLSESHQFYNFARWVSLIIIAILFAAIILAVQYSRYRLEQKNRVLRKSESELSTLKDKLEHTLQLKLEALTVTERKFFSLFNHAGIGVALVGSDGKPEFSNKTLCDILGYSSQELSVKTFQEFTFPEDIEKDTQLFNRLINKEINNYNIEKRYIRKDGKVIWGDLNISLLMGNNGEIANIIGTVSDVTERKANEEKVFDNAQLLNQVFEAVLSLDNKNTVTYWNNGAVELFGYGQNEVLGCHVSLLYGDKHLPDTHKRISDEFADKTKMQTEVVLKKKDGTSFIGHLSISNRYDNRGNVIGSICSVIDISKQKEHEQKILQINDELEQRVELRTKELKQSYLQIKESEYRLNAAFAVGNYGWWDYQVTEKVFHTHSSRYRILGYTDLEIGNTYEWWRQQVHPNDLKQTDLLFQEMNSGKTSSFKHELRFKHKKGQYIWFYDQGTVIEKDERGNPKRIIGTTQNIDQRKTTELDLLKLSKAVEQSQVVVEITDTKGLIEYVNPAFENLTGYKQQEVIGKNPNILNAHVLPKEVYKNLWQTILKGDTWEGELCNRAKDGTIFWESAIISPIKDENGDIINFIAVKEDITEKRKFLEQLKTAKKEAEEANKAKSEFMANMSHEIRTPMNAVTGFTDILYRQIENQTHREYLNSIKVSGKNLLAIIDDILDLSSIESGKIKLEYSPIDLAGLLNELKGIFEVQANKKGLTFSIYIDENACASFVSDEVRVRQILFNLISNALKFTDKGSVSIRVQTDIKINGTKSRDNVSNILFKVEDTGIGVKKEMLENIFDPFIQQNGQDQKKYGGTGLGLSISKNLANMLGGDISVNSEINQGSTFSFSLKGIKCSLSSDGMGNGNQQGPEILFDPKRVLVVDDIGTNREYMKSALCELGLTVSTAEDGLRALQILEEEEINIILCDLKMPKLDGYGFVNKLRGGRFKELPCIVTTASVLNEELEQIKKHDFDGVMLKPIPLESLIGELKKYLTYTIVETASIIENGSLKPLSLEQVNMIGEELKTMILPLYESIKERQSFQDLNQFADMIGKTGLNHDIDSFKSYATEFHQAIDSFDIEEILKLIKLFKNLIRY
ncbi:PAS domain S-box protein [Saccharicrinis carchari]|nr:PAS domain S-box protein [Saccharicrinis carchari]